MKARLHDLFTKVHYELLISVFLFFELLNRIPPPGEIESWCATPYTLSYRFGFGSRFLIGGIINLFTTYLSINVLWLIILFTLVLLIVFVSILLGKAIRNSTDDVKNFLICLTIIFLASPASISYLFYWGNFGRMDTFLLIFTLLALVCARNTILRWLVPIICFLGMATHQVFVFIFAPLIVVILLFEIKESKHLKSSIVLFCLTCISIIMSFLLFQFFAKNLNVASLQEMMDNIKSYSNVPANSMMLEYEYFKNIHDSITMFVLPSVLNLLVIGGLTFILTSPIFIGFIVFWRNCIKLTKNKFMKLVFIFAMVIPIASLPAFLLTIDWGRWFAAIIICQISLIYYFIHAKEEVVLCVASSCFVLAKKYWAVFLCAILYFTFLGKFEAAAILGVAGRFGIIIIDIIKKIHSILV